MTSNEHVGSSFSLILCLQVPNILKHLGKGILRQIERYKEFPSKKVIENNNNSKTKKKVKGRRKIWWKCLQKQNWEKRKISLYFFRNIFQQNSQWRSIPLSICVSMVMILLSYWTWTVYKLTILFQMPVPFFPLLVSWRPTHQLMLLIIPSIRTTSVWMLRAKIMLLNVLI